MSTQLHTVPRSPARHGFRKDVQGLRALAVVLVILNHLGGHPSGGYIGVDVFFVISGYLITGQIARELSVSGKVSLASFYARRIRRIVPVAVVVAVCTVFVAYLVWYLPRAHQSALDAIYALLWVANWHFAGMGTDYLQASATVSPIQHYWSLSVEEQFYIFWPWLLIAFSVLMPKILRLSVRRSLCVGIAVFALTSFAWSVALTDLRSSWAYFDTLGRGWEFAAGALLALAPINEWLGRRKWARWLPLTGLLIIVSGAFILTEHSRFPGPWAVIPVLGAALVIAGNDNFSGNRPAVCVLTNRVSLFIGSISYSLYLWHFPVIVFIETVFPSQPVLAIILALFSMVILSVLSFLFIEEPIRRSGWLKSWEDKNHFRGSKKAWFRDSFTSTALAAFIVALSASQLFGPLAMRDALTAFSLFSNVKTAEASHRYQSEVAIAEAVAHAASAPDSPKSLNPDINALGIFQQAPAMSEADGCRNGVGAGTPKFCNYGSDNSSKTALVLGDSIAMSWMPAISAALHGDDWNVVGLGFSSCSPYDIDTLPRSPSSSFLAECRSSKEKMFEAAAELKPDVIIVSSTYDKLASGATGDDEGTAWQAAVERSVRNLALSADSVVVLPAPPQGPDMRSCANRVLELSRCSGALSASWFLRTQAEQDAVKSLQLQGIDATYVSVRDWFCTRNGICPASIGGQIVRVDAAHLTNAYAESLGGLLAPYLRDASGK